jgi:hypothetical protein
VRQWPATHRSDRDSGMPTKWHEYPVPGSLPGGAQVGFECIGSVMELWAALFTWACPLNIIYPIFQLSWVCKIQNPTLCCSKIYQIVHTDRLNDMEQLYFLKKVQIPNRM